MAKKVRIKFHLAALTRMVFDFEEEVEVEEGQLLSEQTLIEMANERYDATDGSEFEQDYDFWEKGACWAELAPGDKEHKGSEPHTVSRDTCKVEYIECQSCPYLSRGCPDAKKEN